MQKFMARQPILDARVKTYGYELLFRSGVEPYFNCQNADHATSSVVDSCLLLGMQTLTDGGKAFINFTRNILLNQFATLLPKDQIIVEITEDVQPDPEVLEACRSLKRQGYTLALDDFVLKDGITPLVDLADIIKVDFQATPRSDWTSLAKSMRSRGIKLVAEKVETPEQYRQAIELGYNYFQGYFFSKPEIVEGRQVPAYKLNYILLIKAISRREPDFTEIEGIIKREPSLTYKLLRYLNSAAFAFYREITSIRHALSLLGMQEVQKWVALVALAGMGADKPAALAITTMIRARMCELLAPITGHEKSSLSLFLIGLLSAIDAILQRPMQELLKQLSVPPDVYAALVQGNTPLRQVLDLCIAVETGDWDAISRLSSSCRISETKVSDVYLQSVRWSNQVFHVGESVLTH